MAKPGDTKTVKAWMAALDPPQRKAAEALRRLAHACIPNLSETIKWGRPVFGLARDIAYLGAAKHHITFGFVNGVDLDDPHELLEGTGKQMRNIKVRTAADIPEAALKKWLKQAARQVGP